MNLRFIRCFNIYFIQNLFIKQASELQWTFTEKNILQKYKWCDTFALSHNLVIVRDIIML